MYLQLKTLMSEISLQIWMLYACIFVFGMWLREDIYLYARVYGCYDYYILYVYKCKVMSMVFISAFFVVAEFNDYCLNVKSVHRRHCKFHRNVDEILVQQPSILTLNDTFPLEHYRGLAYDNLKIKINWLIKQIQLVVLVFCNLKRIR